MTRWIRLVPIVLLAVGGWLLLRGASESETSSGDPADAGREQISPPRPDPHLVGTGEPVETRDARGELEGVVLLDGRPARAEIRLRPFDGCVPPADRYERSTWLVTAHLPAGDPVRVIACESGTFRVDDLEVGPWFIEAHAKTSASGWQVLGVEAERRTVTKIVLASASHSLEGRLRWRDGRSFEGVVFAYPSGGIDSDDLLPDTLPLPVSCDENGRFRIPAVPAGRCALSALLPGRLRAVLGPVDVPTAGPVDLIVDRGLAKCRGTVLDAESGHAIAGATIRCATGWEVGSTHVRATTDEAGRFVTWCEPPPGGGDLEAMATGYAARWIDAEDLSEEIVIRLRPSGGVRGRVLTADGRPAAGAVVHAQDPEERPTIRATAGEDGRYALPCFASSWGWLVVLGGGWCSAEAPFAVVRGPDPLRMEAPGRRGVARDLRAVPSARLRGRVLSVGGAPIGYAKVELDGPRGMHVGYLGLRTTADAAGGYDFPDVPPGIRWELRPVPDLGHEWDGPSILLDEGEDARLDVRLPRAERAVILVSDATSGAALAHARAWPEWADTPLAANNEGRIDLGWSGGSTVDVAAYGYVTRRVLLPGDDAGVDHRIELEPSEGIAGRVTGLPSGTDPAEVRVEIGDRELGTPIRSDGTFEDPSFPPWPCLVRAELEREEGDWEASRYVRPGERDVRLELSPREPSAGREAPTWRLRILDPQRRLIRYFRYQRLLLSADGKQEDRDYGARWGGRGALDLDLAEYHEGHVAIYRFQDEDGRPLELAPVEVGPLGRSGGMREVIPEPGLAIEGRVRNAEDGPVAGAHVKAECLEGMSVYPPGPERPYGPVHAETRTERDGRFRLPGLGPWTYRLTVRGHGLLSPVRVPSVAGGTTDVEVVIEPTGDADVVVLGPHGEPVEGAWITCDGREGRSKNGRTTDGRGRARLHGIPSERPLKLKVFPPDEREDLDMLTLPGWQARDTTVRLEAALPEDLVTGRVVGPGGVPVCGARVRLVGHVNTSTRVDGGFSFDDLADGESGRLELRVRYRGPPLVPPLDIVAPAHDLVLRVPGSHLILLRLRNRGSSAWERDVRLLSTWDGEYRTVREIEVEGLGTLAFAVPDPSAEYAVYVVPCEEDVRIGWRTGLRPGGTPYDVSMGSGAEMDVLVRTPAGIDPATATVRVDVPGAAREARADSTGRCVIPALPPGTWEVSARVGRYYGSTTIAAPGSGTILLR